MPYVSEQHLAELHDAIERRDRALERARHLVALLTVRQVIEAGEDAIRAAGLNPWCINEGRASGDERLDTWFLDAPAAPDGGSQDTASPPGR